LKFKPFRAFFAKEFEPPQFGDVVQGIARLALTLVDQAFF
jgi:hypothetical protein